MKQIIKKYSNGSIDYKYYKNNRGQRHCLYIEYWENGNIWWKGNYINGEIYGLDTWWDKNGKINEQRYFL